MTDEIYILNTKFQYMPKQLKKSYDNRIKDAKKV